MLTNLLDFISELRDGHGVPTAVLFFRLKNASGGHIIQKVNVTDKTQLDIFEKYCDVLYLKISEFQTHESNTVLNIDEYDYTRQDVRYSFNRTQLEANMTFLAQDYLLEQSQFNMNDIDKVDGVIIRVGTAEKFANLYVPYFPVYSLARDQWFVIRGVNVEANNMDEQFVSNEEEKFVRFNYNISFVYFDNKLLVLDFKKLEKGFEYGKKMTQRAREKVRLLITNGFLSANSTLEALMEVEPSLRNKLLKISNTSPVFSIPKPVIVTFVNSKPKLKKFHISAEGEFEVNSKEKAKLFLKLMDDDFVKSELTGMEYDAEKKNIIE